MGQSVWWRTAQFGLPQEKHANEPAFLRRLRAQNSGNDDRHERQIARPRKPKDADDDDAPTYVIEESNDTLSKEEYEALVSGKGDAGEGSGNTTVKGKSTQDEPKASGALPPDGETDAPTSDGERKKQPAEAGIGSKKRKVAKVAKVVGRDDGEEENEKNDTSESVPKITKKPKKKAKAIKLSFGDE
ncbi:hypothetical protein M8818_000453 [Zalaria obscura]|uniref:Uncharacterized protein n=1 Tax=Zalaria obscura TaxID=2024903 RepID=A0ACC3SPR3_9PEZI